MINTGPPIEITSGDETILKFPTGISDLHYEALVEMIRVLRPIIVRDPETLIHDPETLIHDPKTLSDF